jgi:hypothetical protein
VMSRRSGEAAVADNLRSRELRRDVSYGWQALRSRELRGSVSYGSASQRDESGWFLARATALGNPCERRTPVVTDAAFASFLDRFVGRRCERSRL